MKKNTIKAAVNSILNEDSSFDYTEAYVRLRTNFIYTTLNGTYKTVLFTSCEQGEGKSTTVLNLAISLAKSGKKVLVVDCDIRRSSLRIYLRQKKLEQGYLSDILCGLKTVNECLCRNKEYGFDIIFSGKSVPNPSELLGSATMKKLLETLAPHYDYILLDAPPVLTVSDGLILAGMADGVVFVVRQNMIRTRQYNFAIQSLENVGARMLGSIMSMYRSKHDQSAYRYGYGYGYGYRHYKKYYTYE